MRTSSRILAVVLSRSARRANPRSQVYSNSGTQWTAGQPCDEALMVPNFYVETGCQLYRLLDCFFVVGTLHNFGGSQKVMTSLVEHVDAV